MDIDFKFPAMNTRYWGSFQKDAGFETSINNGSLSVSYHVFISDIMDGMNLIRRPVANWFMRKLEVKTHRVTAYLLQSVDKKLEADENADEDDLCCIETEGVEKKHYLFSVRR